MTEQEIIDVLKDNKTKGVAFMFMPEVVIDWVHDNFDDPKLLNLTPDGSWQQFFKAEYMNDDFDNVVFALPDNYPYPKQESKGEWVECEIKKNDCFFLNGQYYHWSEWNICLIQNNDWIKAFGGWQYKDSKGWFTTPQVEIENGYLSDNYCLEVKPAIPKKIRFWKESR